MVWRRRVVRVREAGREDRATTTSKRPARPQLLKPSPVEVLAAVRSLYAEDVKPLGRIVRKRCGERAAVSSGLPLSSPPDVDPRYLRRVCEDSGAIRVEVEEGGEWIALLRGAPPTFVDFYDVSDPYPAEMWAQAADYFGRPEAEDMVLPGGRYACAQELLDRGLPFLTVLSLGQVCHVIQLAVSQRRVLGYRNGDTVPYRFSQSRAKEECAAEQKPSTSKHSELPLADWENARRCLREMLASAPGPRPGAVTVSNVKRMFRTRFQLELSETALGHSKLTELLQDPKLSDVCSVQLQGRGYAVVECTGAGAAIGDVEQELKRKEGAASSSSRSHGCFGSPSGSTGRKEGAASSSSRSPECFGSPSGSTGIESHDDFEAEHVPREPKLHEHGLGPTPVDESEGTTSRLSSLSNSGNDGPLGSAVSRTFIHFADPAPQLADSGSCIRARSVPKDFGSGKDSCDIEDLESVPRCLGFAGAGSGCDAAGISPPSPDDDFAQRGPADGITFEWSEQCYVQGLQPWSVEAMSEYSPYVAWFGVAGWSEDPPPCSWWTGADGTDNSLQPSATHATIPQLRQGAGSLEDLFIHAAGRDIAKEQGAVLDSADLTPSQQRLLRLRSSGQATMRMINPDAGHQPSEADRFTGLASARSSDNWERNGNCSPQVGGKKARGRRQAAR